MREIKFRAWHKETESMFVPDFIYLKDGRPGIAVHDKRGIVYDAEVMQYTGLKDKNGKEIYEGDIVKVLYTDWASKEDSDPRTLSEYLDSRTIRMVIGYNPPRFTMKVEPDGYEQYIGGYHPHGYIEIIGNIYENPELLEDKL